LNLLLLDIYDLGKSKYVFLLSFDYWKIGIH
jgi:hypothetical protein